MYFLTVNINRGAGGGGGPGVVVEAEQEFELRPFGPRVCALCSELDYEPSESEVLVIQSCPTLLRPHHCSPPDSSVHGNLQARILEWVAIPPSRDQTRVSCTVGTRESRNAQKTFVEEINGKADE